MLYLPTEYIYICHSFSSGFFPRNDCICLVHLSTQKRDFKEHSSSFPILNAHGVCLSLSTHGLMYSEALEELCLENNPNDVSRVISVCARRQKNTTLESLKPGRSNKSCITGSRVFKWPILQTKSRDCSASARLVMCIQTLMDILKYFFMELYFITILAIVI